MSTPRRILVLSLIGGNRFVAGLGGKADRRIGRAIAFIATPLDQFEKHPPGKGAAVELEIFGLAAMFVRGAVIKDVTRGHALDKRRVQPPARLQIVIIIARDLKAREPRGNRGIGRSEDIGASQRNMLDARAILVLDEPRAERLRRQRPVQRKAHRLVRRFHRLALH